MTQAVRGRCAKLSGVTPLEPQPVEDLPVEVLPRVLRLLWGHDEPARRGPKPARTIHEIAEAAVRVADAVGLDGLSMSAVAKEVGVTQMALYRYVDAKSDLYTAMLDVAYGPPPAEPATGEWREQLDAWARGNVAILRRHPWIVQIRVEAPPLGPWVLGWMERGLRAFDATPLGWQQRLSSLLLVEVYVRGQSLVEVVEQPAGSDADQLYGRRLMQLIDAERYPTVHAAASSGALTDGEGSEFDFGLETVLDGIAAQIARLQAPPGPARPRRPRGRA